MNMHAFESLVDPIQVETWCKRIWQAERGHRHPTLSADRSAALRRSF